MAKSDSDSGSLWQDQPELLQINGGFLTGIYLNGKFQTFHRNSETELLIEDSSKRKSSLSSNIVHITRICGYMLSNENTKCSH
jgi:hypothetical protein